MVRYSIPSSANSLDVELTLGGRLSMYARNNRGPKDSALGYSWGNFGWLRYFSIDDDCVLTIVLSIPRSFHTHSCGIVSLQVCHEGPYQRLYWNPAGWHRFVFWSWLLWRGHVPCWWAGSGRNVVSWIHVAHLIRCYVSLRWLMSSQCLICSGNLQQTEINDTER